MFKSARWRNEKNKIKAVFRLQFHATQVPQVGGDSLTVSVIPADVGKPTARLEKAIIQDGSCYWNNPIFETVKFVREPKSGKIHERFYNFVIGTGSSKAGVIGEASIDFSSYALATKISSLSLPLKNSKSEFLLHVSIQRMPESFDQREVKEIENVKLNSQDRSLKAQMSDGDMDGSIKSSSAEDASLNKGINCSAGINDNRRASSVSDVTMSSSDSSLGLDTSQEIQMKNDNVLHDPNTLFSSLYHGSVLQKSASDITAAVCKRHEKSWEWLGGLTLEASTDDSSGTPREGIGLPRVASQEGPDIVENLTALARQAEMSELELQTLRKKIVKESRRGHDLSKEIIKLKEERDAFKEESENLKAIHCRLADAKARKKLQFEGGDPQVLLEELRQELNYEKDLNSILQVQLQKTQESNSELILAVRDLDEILERKNKEIADLSDKSGTCGQAEVVQGANYEGETDDEQKALEELVKEHIDAKESYLLEQKVMDLQSEMRVLKREKEELEMQMEQLALDYEILKQENHEMSYKLEQGRLQEQLKMQYECSSSYVTLNELETHIESLENELNKRSEEFSDSLNTIGELESQVKALENELNNRSQEYSDSIITIRNLEDQIKNLDEELENQAQGFEADLEALTHAKVEQEQRAIQSEENLRKMRWENASMAQRLQDEFRKFSVQMVYTFRANESLAAKALTEANVLRLQNTHLQEKLKEACESLQLVREHHETRLHELSSQVSSMSNEVEELQSEVTNKSVQLEHQLKHAEETQIHLAQEIPMLKAKIGALVEDNRTLSEQAINRESLTTELEHTRKSFMEMEMLFKQGKNEKAELENRVALLREKVEESVKELHSMTCLKDEKESIAKVLQLEVDTLKVQCDELKQTVLAEELDKENLRKQIFQLKSDLKKKEDAFNGIDKKMKCGNGLATVSDGTKAASESNMFQPVPFETKEVSNIKEKIKLLEVQIKLKESAVEKSTNSFLEKEKELQNKIEELEDRLDVVDHSTTRFCEQKSIKATKISQDRLTEAFINAAENLSPKIWMPSENDSSIKRNLDDLPRNDWKSFGSGYVDELLSEMTLLKERNKLMENELKEMQERYSEISLRFAEVEGERQQLVMKFRTLKNAKKIP